ncbi:MAG: GNAT family N-acetyltransferase [Microlunatus sp.]
MAEAAPSVRDLRRRVAEGQLDMLVAIVDSHLAGYLLIEPRSSYPPFAAADIPEIADFNVLPGHRRQGVGTALMDEAERRVAQFSDIVGLGVGLYTDYGTAQRNNHRRQGVGNALMEEAERRVAQFSDIVGLGVGLYTDYGTAQRMYVRRGYLPDGAGVVLHGVPVEPGAEITLDDNPVLMFTKQLRRARLSEPHDSSR